MLRMYRIIIHNNNDKKEIIIKNKQTKPTNHKH